MVDNVAYWMEMAEESLEDAKWALKGERKLFTGFCCHLATEKILKSYFWKIINETPPRIHDLVKLAKRTLLYDELSEEQIEFLEVANALQIEARYSSYKDKVNEILTKSYCESLIVNTEDFICFLKTKLGR